MKNNISLLTFILCLLFFSCIKEASQSSLQKVDNLAKNYNFQITSNLGSCKNNLKNILELEKEMSRIYSENKLVIISKIDKSDIGDTANINRKIEYLRNLLLKKGQIVERYSINADVDPVYKYARIIYFKNPGILPNYSVTIQYNANHGNFTNANISISTYGGMYATGNFALVSSPQVFFLRGSLAFQAYTSMTYTLNFPGISYLGLSSTNFTQFNGWLQLDESNNIVNGSGSQSPYDPDSKYQK